MAKTKRILSLFVVALMTVFTVLSYVPAKAATAAPKLSVVTQPAAEYTPDQTISFTVNAHYAGKVMYRVILYNGTTKLTSNLWNTPKTGYYYTKWTPSGTMDFNIHWAAKQLQPGYYSMTVLAKKVGSKAKYDTYVDTHSFLIKNEEATISSIADVTATVDEGGAYTLPATVSAKMSDDTTKDVAVVWTPATVDTTKVGDQTFTGKVEGYAKDVKLTLTVKEVPVAVTSVSAINAKSLKVTFSKAVTDASKITFDVKRGTTSVTLTPSWNTDKTEATLSSSANLLAGDYTVTVAGDTFATGKNAGTVTVVAQKVGKIEFPSQELVKNSTGSAATFRYKVYDQYGTDVTKDMAASKFSVSGIVGNTTVTPTPTLTPSTGVGSLTHTFVATDTKAVITIVDTATGTSATATMDVAAAATVSSLEFGTPVLPTNKVNIETGLAEAAKIPVTVTDQYGNTITDLSTLNSALTLLSSNSNVAPTFAVEENVPYIKLNTSTLTEKATVVITAVNITNGKTFSNVYTVQAPAAAYSIELGDFSENTIAVGDENVVLNATISDQFGNVLTPAQVAKNAGTINAWFNTPTYLGHVVVDTDRNSATYGKLVINLVGDTNNDGSVTTADTAVNADNGSTDVLVVTPANYKVQTKSVLVSPARVVSEVGNVSGSTLMQGATKNVKLALYDQYESKLANGSVAGGSTYNNSDLSYKVFLTKTSGDDGAVTATVNGVTVTPEGITGSDEQYIASIPVAAATDKTGTYTLKVQLLNSDLEVVSEASTTLTVVKNNVSGITYTVDDIPTLAGNKDSAYTAAASDGHAVAISVTAKDASGNEYVINPADVVNVTADNDIVSIAKAADNTWYVAGKDVSSLTADQRTAKLTVTINTLDGFQTITKDVTVSPVAPVIQQIKVVDSALGAESRDLASDFPDLTDKLTYDFTSKTTAAAGIAIHVIGLDQYGCWNDLSNASSTVIGAYTNSTDLAPINAFSINNSGNLVLSGDASKVTTGVDLLVTLTAGNASKQIVVKVAE